MSGVSINVSANDLVQPDTKPLTTAITWANVDPDICHHMMSLRHNELIKESYFLTLQVCSCNPS